MDPKKGGLLGSRGSAVDSPIVFVFETFAAFGAAEVEGKARDDKNIGEVLAAPPPMDSRR